MLRSFWIIAILFYTNIHAYVDWPNVVEEIQQSPTEHSMTLLYAGASNINYSLVLDGIPYFFRCAPDGGAPFADLDVEYDVLQALRDLKVSAQPLYYDRDKKILVTEWISDAYEPVDLLDPSIRQGVLALLHRIEKTNIKISRVFQPYSFVLELLEQAREFPEDPLPQQFYTILLPALQHIDAVLAKNPKNTLCHLDLHSKNVLKNSEQFWIIDWEYAMMSHPFLVLASMASIERWDDATMRTLLEDYVETPSEEDFQCLYCYRIAIDIFWTAWNHIQSHRSPIDKPYAVWEKLFYDAAMQRVEQLIHVGELS